MTAMLRSYRSVAPWRGLTLALRAALVAPLFLAAACASVPRGQAASFMSYSVAVPIGFSPDVRSIGLERRIAGRAPEDNLVRLRATADDGSLDILALSGGGANGAFAAGVLVGLSAQGARPQYEVVTGVSAGALIAPFAFVGAEWDVRLREAFTGGQSDNLLRWRGLGVLFGAGLNSGEPLRDLVEDIVTDELLAAVAREAGEGRMLLVVTTDLDRQEPVLWDMGAIAALGGEPARELFRDVLVASASVPGLFPPVIITASDGETEYTEMHVDGGNTTPFVVAPAVTYLESDVLEGLRGANVYVLISGPLRALPRTTRQATMPILARSFSTLMMHMTRNAVVASAAFSVRNGMRFHVAAMPSGAAEEDWLDFSHEHLIAVFDMGMRQATEASFWLDAQTALAPAQ